MIAIYVPSAKQNGFKIYLCLRSNWYALVITWRQLKGVNGNSKDTCSSLWAGARIAFFLVLPRSPISCQFLYFREYAFHSSPPTTYVHRIQQIVWQYSSDTLWLLVMPLPLQFNSLEWGKFIVELHLSFVFLQITLGNSILLGVSLHVSAKLSND